MVEHWNNAILWIGISAAMENLQLLDVISALY